MAGFEPGESPRPLVVWVEQRDGSLVPLEALRLAEDLQNALDRAGYSDPLLCQEVLEVVRLSAQSRLERRYAQGEPRPYLERGALGDLVEQALVQMGNSALAKSYILLRDARHRARAALSVLPGSPKGSQPTHLPVVRDGSGSTPWDSGRIAHALVREAELPQELAQEVARRVERRVFDAGLRRLNSSLVRAFVDNELGAMGLEAALERQRPVGIPRHDLRQALAPQERGSGPARPRGLAGRLGGEILRRFVLEDVLDPEASLLHQRGDVHLSDLAAPHQPLVLGLPSDLLIEGAPTSQTPLELLQRLGPLLASTSRALVLEDLEPSFAAVGRGGRATAAAIDFQLALGALALTSGREVELANPGGRAGRWSAVLLDAAWQVVQQGALPPRLWLDGVELRAALERDGGLREAIEGLFDAGRLVGIWHGGGERYAGSGLRRKGRERGALALGGALSLNLPRLARQAGPWREERFLEAIVDRVRAGVRLLAGLDRFQKGREELPGHLRPRTAFALAPIGLYQALWILGDGEIRADQGARILGLLAEAVVRFGREENLAVHLDGVFGAEAAVRFAGLDREAAEALQGRLFSDLPTPEADPIESYSVGFLPPPAERAASQETPEHLAAYLARLLVGVRAGALFAPSDPTIGPAGGPAPRPGAQLALWNRFEAARSEHLEPNPPVPALAPEPSSSIPLFDTTG